MKLPNINDTVADWDGNTYLLTELIGEGAQGLVFKTNHPQFIVKVARVESENKARWIKHKKWLLKQRIPKQTRIIAPIALLEEPHIGYVMHYIEDHVPLTFYLVPDEEEDLSTWYNITTGGVAKRLEIMHMLSLAYRNLHTLGLCYCDVSPMNILVSKQKRSAWIIDADNITAPGILGQTVIGTPRYIAPELYRESRDPNSLTDTYSFAVLLFELFCLGHPFVGDDIADSEPEIELEAYKGNVPYVAHPTNDSNRSSTSLGEEFVLTHKLRALLQLTFVDSTIQPMKRPTLYEFAKAIEEAIDLLMVCPDCQASYVLEEEALCPWCDAEHNDILVLTFKQKNLLRSSDLMDGRLPVEFSVLGKIIVPDYPKAIYTRHFQMNVSNEANRTIGAVKRVDNNMLFFNKGERDFVLFNLKTREKTKVAHGQQVDMTPDDILIIDHLRHDVLDELFDEQADILTMVQLSRRVN